MSSLPTNKERIFKTAIGLFASRGFRGTSIRDIANAMNISLSGIYHHFGNKEGLLLAILEHSSQRLVRELRQIAETDAHPEDRFRKLIETHVRLSGNYNEEAKIFFLDEEHLSEEGQKYNRSIQREIYVIYMKVVRELKDLGIIQSKSLSVLVFNILGVVNWQLRWFRADGALSMEQVGREICEFILYGAFGRGEAPDAD